MFLEISFTFLRQGLPFLQISNLGDPLLFAHLATAQATIELAWTHKLALELLFFFLGLCLSVLLQFRGPLNVIIILKQSCAVVY